MATGSHNLAHLAEESFARHGDYPALFFEGTWHTTGELRDRTHRLAAGFGELGIEPGDRIAVMMANCPEVGICYQALWRAGAVITPAIFLLPPPALRHILEDSEARAIITTPEFLPNVMEAARGLPELKWVLCLGPEHEGVVPLASLEDAAPGEIVPRADDDLAGLLYTGATTGRSKGVMLSHENMWWCGKGALPDRVAEWHAAPRRTVRHGQARLAVVTVPDVDQRTGGGTNSEQHRASELGARLVHRLVAADPGRSAPTSAILTAYMVVGGYSYRSTRPRSVDADGLGFLPSDDGVSVIGCQTICRILLTQLKSGIQRRFPMYISSRGGFGS